MKEKEKKKKGKREKEREKKRKRSKKKENKGKKGKKKEKRGDWGKLGKNERGTVREREELGKLSWELGPGTVGTI